MSDIQISDLSIRDCDISVWNQDESCCVMLFRPPHTMTLEIADGKDRKPTPWFYSIEFASRAEWFKFVRLVNAMNRKIKRPLLTSTGSRSWPNGGRMKPTDEERREVAQKLRESRSFVDGLGRCGMTQNALDTFERILECVGYETGDVFDFLAGLIEPAPERTCMPIMPPYEPGVEEIPVCSECGRQMFIEDGDAYCPRCGAKVIEEES